MKRRTEQPSSGANSGGVPRRRYPLILMGEGGEDPGWSRSEWARWWLDHGDAKAAAFELEPGDEVDVAAADFADLARALFHQGLVALYDDGHAFVHTPEQADQILAEMARDVLAASDRKAPARSPAPPSVVSPRPVAPRRPRAATAPDRLGQSRRR